MNISVSRIIVKTMLPLQKIPEPLFWDYERASNQPLVLWSSLGLFPQLGLPQSCLRKLL